MIVVRYVTGVVKSLIFSVKFAFSEDINDTFKINEMREI